MTLDFILGMFAGFSLCAFAASLMRPVWHRIDNLFDDSGQKRYEEQHRLAVEWYSKRRDAIKRLQAAEANFLAAQAALFDPEPPKASAPEQGRAAA